jgi:hypothetical protein
MAAVRQTVIDAAAAKASAAGVITGTVIGGSLVMKKWMLGAAALLLLVSGLWLADLWGADGSPAVEEAVTPKSVPAQTVTNETATDETGAAGHQRDEIARVEEEAGDAEAATQALLRGVVRGPDGGVVAGAEVFLGRGVRTGDEWQDASGPETTTDAQGRFELDCAGSNFVLTAMKGELISDMIVQGRVQGRTEIDGLEIRLAQTAIAEGVLVDHEGRPIAGHPVKTFFSYGISADTQSPVPGVMVLRAIEHRLVTDAAGRFRVRLIAGRQYGWEVLHEHHPMLRDHHGTDDSPFELRMGQGTVVAGRVLRADGSPAAGAVVELNDHPRRRAECGADGSFQLVGTATPKAPQPRGAARVVGARDVHQIRSPYLKVMDAHSAIHIVQLERARQDLDIRLEQPLRLAGRVLHARGAPIAGAKLRIVGDREFEPGFGHAEKSTWEWAHDCDEVASDAAGRFAFERLYAGEFEVRVQIPGDRDIPLTRRVMSGQEDIVFRVDPNEVRGVVLQGSVRDALSREPVSRFTVTPWVEGESFAKVLEVRSVQGVFELKGIEPGRIRLTFAADGYAEQSLAMADYAAGVHRIEVELTPTRALDVRVTDGRGVPVQMFQVRARRAQGQRLDFDIGGRVRKGQITARKGVARLRGLPAERVTLIVEVSGLPVIEELVDLSVPRPEPLVVMCGKRSEAVSVEALVVCVDAKTDVTELEQLFAKKDLQSMRQLMRRAYEREDVRFPDRDVRFELAAKLAGVRPSTAKLTFKGTKKHGPMSVPIYARSEQRFDGTSYFVGELEMPTITIGHLRQDLVLKVTLEGHAPFEQTVPATAFVAGRHPQEKAVPVLVVLRRK